MGMSALIVVTALMAAPIPKESPAAEASAKKVKELRKERIAVLKDVVEVSTKLAQNARIEIADALDDRMTLLQAELDAAEKESERIALYMKALDSLKVYAELAKARFEAGRGTELAVLKVKAKRLEIEIQLEQAKIREVKEK